MMSRLSEVSPGLLVKSWQSPFIVYIPIRKSLSNVSCELVILCLAPRPAPPRGDPLGRDGTLVTALLCDVA